MTAPTPSPNKAPLLGKLLGFDQNQLIAAIVPAAKELLGDMTLAEWLEKYGDTHQVGFSVSVVDNAVTGSAWIEPKPKKET